MFFAVEGSHQGSCTEACAAQDIHKKKTRKRLSDYVPCLVCHPVLLHLQPPILERRSILAQFQVLLSQAQTSKCVCIEETMLVFYVRFVCFSEHTEYNE